MRPKALDAWDSLKGVKRQGRGQRGEDRREERRGEGDGEGRGGDEERGSNQKGGTQISLFCRRGEIDQFKSMVSRLYMDWRKVCLALICSDFSVMEIHKEKESGSQPSLWDYCSLRTILPYGWVLGEEEGWLRKSLHQGFYKRFGGLGIQYPRCNGQQKLPMKIRLLLGRPRAHYSRQVQCCSEIRQSQKFPFTPLRVGEKLAQGCKTYLICVSREHLEVLCKGQLWPTWLTSL